MLDPDLDALTPAQLVGQLLVVGFDGQRAPSELGDALAQGERAGVILFRRNLTPGRGGLGELQDSCAELAGLAPPGLPPLIAIDEEGGRVARLSPPALVLPPMRRIASLGDLGLLERVGLVMGQQLRCLGLTMNFAPVVDVDTNPDNPVIGDRAFSRDPSEVASCAGAYLRGLGGSGLLGCLKHYPGHGDTLEDSHHALPTVPHDRARLEAVELLPFRRLAQQADSMMTAHVVYPGLDPGSAATLSSFISGTLLRAELGFEGVLFSDDLEMQAIAGHAEPEQSAVQAIEAGCDILLACSRAEVQARVHAALLEQFERSAPFAARCRQAAGRSLAMRRRCPPRPGSGEELSALLRSEVPALEAELERRLAS
ncbi:MAG TPA: beta-N-acetylhexosaminidase, partial [Polyangiaceae bacterium]|nr:beta-N-acetylhexosaminidase [Polyangiaceae bacterium]